MTHLISISEACEMLGVGRTKLYDLISQRAVHSLKIGSRRLVLKESIARFVEISVATGLSTSGANTASGADSLSLCNSHRNLDSLSEESSNGKDSKYLLETRKSSPATSFGGVNNG